MFLSLFSKPWSAARNFEFRGAPHFVITATLVQSESVQNDAKWCETMKDEHSTLSKSLVLPYENSPESSNNLIKAWHLLSASLCFLFLVSSKDTQSHRALGGLAAAARHLTPDS